MHTPSSVTHSALKLTHMDYANKPQHAPETVLAWHPLPEALCKQPTTCTRDGLSKIALLLPARRAFRILKDMACGGGLRLVATAAPMKERRKPPHSTSSLSFAAHHTHNTFSPTITVPITHPQTKLTLHTRSSELHSSRRNDHQTF